MLLLYHICYVSVTSKFDQDRANSVTGHTGDGKERPVPGTDIEDTDRVAPERRDDALYALAELGPLSF